MLFTRSKKSSLFIHYVAFELQGILTNIFRLLEQILSY